MILTQEDESLLRKGIGQLQLQCSEEIVAKLVSYGNLILKWNKVYNLTAIRKSSEVTTHHLLDSLAAVKVVRQQIEGMNTPRLLDVGSGAGLPGLVLAICFPSLQVVTLDTVQKKVAFMRQAIASLGLSNAEAVQHRVEQWQVDQPFDLVCSRAFSTMNNMIAWSQHLLAEDGKFLALKGKQETDQFVPENWKILSVIGLDVPFLSEERNIFVISR